MLHQAYGRPVIFISLQTYVAPVLHKIPVLPPDEGGRQEKGILRNTGVVSCVLMALMCFCLFVYTRLLSEGPKKHRCLHSHELVYLPKVFKKNI